MLRQQRNCRRKSGQRHKPFLTLFVCSELNVQSHLSELLQITFTSRLIALSNKLMQQRKKICRISNTELRRNSKMENLGVFSSYYWWQLQYNHQKQLAKLCFTQNLWILCLKTLQQCIYHGITESKNGSGWKIP